ncbi:unnamed protein product [Ostreobium quekettii]|uniref:ABC transporter domain-containing protein n=1 Tax=Ostreobium quekettii TaxID=121088 RepID=A0A8S1IZX0_9CHLO|nr:unnamed protein product [Ostreobium quekettii]|eukprot:evm.model.scf_138.4 EVM.evm.TU.scf_138.4   scf_138:51320-55219(+)
MACAQTPGAQPALPPLPPPAQHTPPGASLAVMLDVLLGGAAIAVPQYQNPLLAASLLLKAIGAIRRRRAPGVADGDGRADGIAPGRVDLDWAELRLTLTLKDGSLKKILDGVSGSARAGRLLAIMGPSGSGKTSLLNALARQVPKTKGMKFTGRLTVNGSAAGLDGLPQAYVQQDDLFFSQLTVREILTMAAHLRLPPSMADAAKDEYVERLIAKLGLSNSTDTRVGDAKTRGISNGEKKRLSIGCELIHSPSLIFVDEPTTGLDSFQAEKVMETLKDLVRDGHTVICSIHQPRSSIFAMFDDLILLCEGRTVYSGPAEKAIDHFATMGLQCPAHYNPAEFLADQISLDTSSDESREKSQERINKLVAAWREKGVNSNNGKQIAAPATAPATVENGVKAVVSNGVTQATWLRQFRLLFRRSWRQAVRDKATNATRAMININSAIVFGFIYFRLKATSATVQDRLGLLQVSAVNTAMSSLMKTISVFPSEKTVVARERAKRSYGVLPYFLGKLIAELPITAAFPVLFSAVLYPMTGLNPSPQRVARFFGIVLLESFASSAFGLTIGSIAPTKDAALAMGPAMMLIFIVFGGYYVNAENVSALLKWIPKASLIQWGFQGMCVNEFKGAPFEEQPGAKVRRGAMKDGDEVLQWLSYDTMPISRAVVANARIMLFHYWLTYNILKARKPQFEKMEPPPES